MERDRNRDRDRRDDGKPKFKKRRKKPCLFCVGERALDYKDIPFVRKFISDRAKILPRRTTGCCALHQRMVAKTIMRARQMALVPYSIE